MVDGRDGSRRRRSRRSSWRRGTTRCSPPSDCTPTMRRTGSAPSPTCSRPGGRRGGRGGSGLLLRPLAAGHATHACSPSRSQLAHQLDLPLVIHTRDAWPDTFDVLDAEGTPERTVFHCFTGGPGRRRPAASQRGAHLSFSGIVTFKGAPEVQEAARTVPARPDADRDRQPVPGPGSSPRQAQPAGLGRRRRDGSSPSCADLDVTEVVAESTSDERPAALFGLSALSTSAPDSAGQASLQGDPGRTCTRRYALHHPLC